MRPFRPLSNVEQLVAYLREEIREGHLSGTMPGMSNLMRKLGVGTKTVVAAMAELEREGILEGQGARRGSRIVASEVSGAPVSLRVRILLYEKDDRKLEYLIDLRHELEEAGHHASFAGKTLIELGMNPKRVARFVEQTEADAWVVVAGSKEVLDWFADQAIPAFALFGRLEGWRIAGTGPKKSTAVIKVVERLVALGHRRIVMLVREERRKPMPGYIERVFLTELEARGIPTGNYNLPDWGKDMKDFHRGLDVSFQHTPPTALLLSGIHLFIAAQQHLALRGIVAPRDVSMICLDPEPAFAWCDPSVAHIDYDSKPWVRRMVKWTNNVAKGKDDRRGTPTPARFVEGGTIGPVPRGV
jgi:DNA-binding LacI/PurR family transcriptional regulator/DNA-binding transcriptional regulator YhcF (GntR family)